MRFGLLVVVSGAAVFAVFAAAGNRLPSLDPSFGGGTGRVMTSFGGPEAVANAVLTQADGTIVAAGQVGLTEVAVSRYRPNGTLDPHFGRGGRLLFTPASTDVGSAYSLATAPNGGVYVGGSAAGNFLVARLDRGGRLDPTFGQDGIARSSFDPVSASVTAMRVEPSGEVLAAGATDDGRVAAARFRTDGEPDTSFGDGGNLVVDVGCANMARGASIQLLPDGRMLIAETTCQDDILVARVLEDGALDSTFGRGGTLVFNFGHFDSATGLAVARDGRATIIGVSQWCADDTDAFSCHSVWRALRLRPDGSLDRTFSGDGIRSLGDLNVTRPEAVSLSRSGETAIAGAGFRAAKAGGWFHVMRIVLLRPDGAYDQRLQGSKLTPAGVLETDFSNRGWFESGEATAISWDRKGRIVAAGHAARQFALARLALIKPNS